MLQGFSDFISKVTRGEKIRIGGKEAQWKKVAELTPGMKIAVPKNLPSDFDSLPTLPGDESSNNTPGVAGWSDSVSHKTPRGWQAERSEAMTPPMVEGAEETSDVIWDEIVSIRRLSPERVYDIEVEATHNFIAGHLIETPLSKTIQIINDEPPRGPPLNNLTMKQFNHLTMKKWFGGFFAHNTYISGSVGIGVTSPAYKIDALSSDTTGVAQLIGHSVTTGTAVNIGGSGITTGDVARIYSGSTSLTTGQLLDLDWSPGTWATASGNLVNINIGEYADTTGNLFNISDNLSSLFSVSTQAVTSALPVAFNAAGDVSIAYDINFTNPTASYIKSQAPLYIQSGEIFNSSDLNLATFNKGNINLTAEGVLFSNSATVSAQLVVGTSTPTLQPINFGKFYLEDSGTSTSSAFVYNSATSGNPHIISIKSNQTTLTGVHFIDLLDANGTVRGKAQAFSTTTVTWQSGGVDFAEYFKVSPSFAGPDNSLIPQNFPMGTVICEGDGTVEPCNEVGSAKMIGIVSSTPAFLGGEEGPDKVMVGLLGQLPVRIAADSEPIHAGDFITSTYDGQGKKATTRGYVLGKALSDWDGQAGTTVWTLVNINYDEGGQLLEASLKQSIDQIQDQVVTLSDQLNAYIAASQTHEATVSTQLVNLTNIYQTISTPSGEISGNSIRSDTTSPGITLEKGDLVALASSSAAATTSTNITIEKSSDPYSQKLFGTVESTYDTQAKVITQGEAYLKVSTINGAIKTGDFLTSSTTPGVAMKANQAGMVIGQALEDLAGGTSTSSSNLTNLTNLTNSSDSGSLTDAQKAALLQSLAADIVASESAVKEATMKVIIHPQIALPPPDCNLTDIICRSTYFAHLYNADVLGLASSSYDGTLPDGFIRSLVISEDLYVGKVNLLKNSGTNTIKEAQNIATVSADTVTSRSIIQLSFEGDYSPATRYFVAKKSPGIGFTVELDQPVATDVPFTYWVLENATPDISPTPTLPPEIDYFFSPTPTPSPSPTPTQEPTPTGFL